MGCNQFSISGIILKLDFITTQKTFTEGNGILKIFRQKHGFTLVELICVLVILAVLAALLVPSLTGYIDKAKQQAVISEAKGIWTAAQSAASEFYGLQNTQDRMDNSLTNSCTIDGVKYTKLGRITNASLYYMQHNWDKTNNEASRVIAQQVLIYLESAEQIRIIPSIILVMTVYQCQERHFRILLIHIFVGIYRITLYLYKFSMIKVAKF